MRKTSAPQQNDAYDEIWFWDESTHDGKNARLPSFGKNTWYAKDPQTDTAHTAVCWHQPDDILPAGYEVRIMKMENGDTSHTHMEKTDNQSSFKYKSLITVHKRMAKPLWLTHTQLLYF